MPKLPASRKVEQGVRGWVAPSLLMRQAEDGDGVMQVFWQDGRGEQRAANPAAQWRDGEGNHLAVVPCRARAWEGPEGDWQVVVPDFILPVEGFIAQ